MAERDAALEANNAAGYMTRPVWTLLCDLPMYANSPRMELPVARRIEATLINIPSSPHLAVPLESKA
jgi:perosamine synthetase